MLPLVSAAILSLQGRRVIASCSCSLQMPAASVPFSVHTWSGILKHLKQMQITGSRLEEGMSWRTADSSPFCQKSLSALVVLRGKEAGSATSEATAAFEAPGLCVGVVTYRHAVRVCAGDTSLPACPLQLRGLVTLAVHRLYGRDCLWWLRESSSLF